jgi:hypothetical protein
MALAVTTPNMYHLQGGGIHVTYSTTSLTGKPQFHYQDAHISKTFTDKEIKVENTSIGSLVSVTLSLTIDSGSTSFSVLIPKVNLGGPDKSAPIHTDGITTIHRLSLVPALNLGQLELYTFTAMIGTASVIVS